MYQAFPQLLCSQPSKTYRFARNARSWTPPSKPYWTCSCAHRVPAGGPVDYTAQTRQRLFFPICDHSSSSFAVENNWRRPHLPERSSKIGIWIEKFRCQNSNFNLPTIKNGFYGYSYLKDPLRMMKRIWAQFWNRWVIPVTWVCLDSATTQNSWRTSASMRAFFLAVLLGRPISLYLRSEDPELSRRSSHQPGRPLDLTAGDKMSNISTLQIFDQNY